MINRKYNIIEVAEQDVIAKNDIYPRFTIITLYRQPSKLKLADGLTRYNDLPYVGQSSTPPTPTPEVSYKKYVALLNNSGSLTATILENTLSGIPVWTNPSNGLLRATLAGEFIAGKTIIFTSGLTSYFILAKKNLTGSDRLDLTFTYYDNTQTGTPNFNDLSIEIRVYP